MFQIGDHIVYGTNGVCLVTDICPSPFDKKDVRTYYVLKPVNSAAGVMIFTPVDNEKVAMRPLMSCREIEGLFSRMPAIPQLLIANEKQRRDAYRLAVSDGNPDSYVSVIKTVLERREEFSGTQRRLPDFEVEYDGMARRHLYTEISVVLGVPLEGMEEYVRQRVEEATI